MSSDAPEFPNGAYQLETQLSEKRRAEILEAVAAFPALLRQALDGLAPHQLEQVYKNWTIAQIVNHLADAQMNWFLRFKLALTTIKPAINPYDQSDWARLPDGLDTDLSASLAIIEGINRRWSELGFCIPPEDYARTMVHPEHADELTLDHALSLANWHCYHHLAQLQWMRENRGL